MVSPPPPARSWKLGARRLVEILLRNIRASLKPLDTGRLYLLNLGALKALELVPLIRVLTGQKTGEDACYFLQPHRGEPSALGFLPLSSRARTPAR